MTILLLRSLTNSGQIHGWVACARYHPLFSHLGCKYVCMFCKFFENQPNEICSYLSEKMSKGRFLKPEKLQNHSKKGKGKEKKKE